MRESRTYGSVRGVPREGHPYRDLSGNLATRVDANNKTTLKTVKIGIKDAASVEIKSGLSLGDTVTTGTVQTK